MAANTATLTTSSTITDSEFRALIQFIANTLESGGVTKTADTGQIDPLTATFPGTNSTSAGYEIREFTDALAGTDPVVMRIDYRRGVVTNRSELGITLGTGSDGSGNITGVEMAAVNFELNNSTQSAACHISAETNRFSILFHASGSVNGSRLGIERTLDTNGNVTNAGLLVQHAASNSYTQRFINYQGTNPAVDTSSIGGGCLPPASQTTGLHSNGNVAVYPNFFFGVGETLVPGKNFVGGFVTDFTVGNQYTVSLLGTDHNMLFGAQATSGGLARMNVPNHGVFGLLMRYE